MHPLRLMQLHESRTIKRFTRSIINKPIMCRMTKIYLAKNTNIDNDFIDQHLQLIHPKSEYTKLLSHNNKQDLFAITAQTKEEVVGLVIAQKTTNKEARIATIKVMERHRNQGIAFHLSKKLERLAYEMGIKKLYIQYQSHKNNHIQMRSLLKSLRWEQPKEEFMLATSDLAHLSQCTWKEKYPLPANYSIKTWDKKSDLSHTLIEAPSNLISSTKSKHLDMRVSQQLLYKNLVVGWIVVDRVAEHTLRYSSLFVSSSYRSRGQGLHLCAAAIKAQIEQGVPFAKAAVAMTNTRTLSLMLKKSRNLIRSLSTSCYSSKTLKKKEEQTSQTSENS